MNQPGWRKRFLTPIQVLLTGALFVEAAAIFGLAAFPALKVIEWSLDLPLRGDLRLLGLGLALGAAWFVFGAALLVLLPLARWITFAAGTPVGTYSYLSWQGWRWASYNALTLFLRFTFVHWIRLTPLLPAFHRLMGMRIGKRVQINTAVVADQNLISIGDDTVIGGDVTLVAHVAERGRLHAAPVVIGRNVTVGLMAVIFPGCVLGDGSILAAGSVLSKGTRVGPGEIWAGVPARRVGTRRLPGRTHC
ncbi:DapH/DapD/GlmU-related protein [Mesoterricola sediminis]|uniref:Uncharacterized protein n=1 Tax=Mesoterricola sediminis TaxID=2927980 RepID=A0AA48GVH4_9BACT|nr:DapH/DapD/GlmU-related protein [Mesoterricola sediminis]BDU78564.1 hypothetical protein METESE_35220 [Mesoterricola sediminis]